MNARQTKKHTAGSKWFDMPAQAPTAELRREVQAMRLHGVLDPKRFLRGEAKRDRNKLPEFFQVRYLLREQSLPADAHAGGLRWIRTACAHTRSGRPRPAHTTRRLDRQRRQLDTQEVVRRRAGRRCSGADAGAQVVRRGVSIAQLFHLSDGGQVQAKAASGGRLSYASLKARRRGGGGSGSGSKGASRK